jgi:NADH-quinone oxidoreductase subunit C
MTTNKPLFNDIIPYSLFQEYNKENCLVISSKNLLICLQILKKHISLQFNLLTCISGVDLLVKEYRFLVVYELLSLVFNTRLRVKIFLDEHTSAPSTINIFVNANWWEREIWDLFGIFFENHSDLRRILNDYSFEGYPMRKDFPVSGFIEAYYSQNIKTIAYEKIQLTQKSKAFA